jgi:hypothetical protein
MRMPEIKAKTGSILLKEKFIFMRVSSVRWRSLIPIHGHDVLLHCLVDGQSHFAYRLFSRFLNPKLAPRIGFDVAFDQHAGIGRDKMHAVAAFLIAFRLILVLRLRFAYLAGLSHAQTRQAQCATGSNGCKQTA